MDLSKQNLDIDKDFHFIRSELGSHLFVVDGSRLYDLDYRAEQQIREMVSLPEGVGMERMTEIFLGEQRYIEPTPLAPPPLRSLSLNVAQSCNMGCKYCYADEGRFGAAASQMMSVETAQKSVDCLFREAEKGVDLVVGFMGGEPLLNRKVVHEITHYAARKGRETGHKVKFSITTNATLIKEEDVDLFCSHPYTITVSIDGNKKLTDELRPMRGKGSSYDKALAGLALLKQHPSAPHVSARITVTPQSGSLLPILQHVLDLGVDDAGFAPVLVSPNPEYAFSEGDFQNFLTEMIACGDACKQALLKAERFPFTNFETALNEIHRGSHRPYPCGAGAAYLSVSAKGGLYACHRLVDDEDYAMGDVEQGSDMVARTEHLKGRHVDDNPICGQCWARYLCGGGCYHEVDKRGRISCDYIRGWLEFCVSAYAELSAAAPDYFREPDQFFQSPQPEPVIL